jgi:hypothetical protein
MSSENHNFLEGLENRSQHPKWGFPGSKTFVYLFCGNIKQEFYSPQKKTQKGLFKKKFLRIKGN